VDIKFIENKIADTMAVTGSIDALTAAVLTDYMLLKVGEGHHNLIVDLSQVEFMSSAGLRALLAALKDCRNKGGDLRISGSQPGVDKVLKMSGFTNILKCFPNNQEALASFSE